MLSRKICSLGAGPSRAFARRRPTIPEELGDRGAVDRARCSRSRTRPAGWPERAREAARHLSSESSLASQSTRLKLLADIQVIFAGRKEDEISSSDLVAELVKLPDRPWMEWSRGKPISSRRVADFLAEFLVFPHKLKTGSRPHGYARSQFEDAFERYLGLPSSSFSPDTPLQSSHVGQGQQKQSVIGKSKLDKGVRLSNFESDVSDCSQMACPTWELRDPPIQEKEKGGERLHLRKRQKRQPG